MVLPATMIIKERTVKMRLLIRRDVNSKVSACSAML